MGTDMDCRHLLSRFDDLMVDERHRSLTLQALEWSLQRAVDPDFSRHAKEAFLSSTFEVFCAPRSPTAKESLLSIKFLLIFFKADDAPIPMLSEFIAQLDGRQDTDKTSPPGELQACYDELIADFHALRCDPSGFQGALRDMCHAMRSEKQFDKEAMTVSEFRRLRKHSVGVPSYTECWRTIRGFSFSRTLADELRRHAILDTAAELAYLANDIGSIDRDEQTARADPQSVDPNFVMLRMRDLGTREGALDEVIALHNTKVADFRRVEHQLLKSEHGNDPALHGYLEILRCTVNGNLATTNHLVPMRYEGAAEPLSRLEPL